MKKEINMKSREIKSLGVIVGIILLFSTMAMAQSSSQDVIQHKIVSIDPMQITSWDKIPKGKIKSNDIEIPIRYIKNKNRIKQGIPAANIIPKQEIDRSQIIQPTLTKSWDSLDNMANANLNGFFIRPPDPIIAAGQNHVGVMVNDVIAFYTKSGSLVTRAGLPNWYINIFNPCGTCFISDPRIVYDQNENRWITVAEGIDTSTSPWTTKYLLSVSKNSDPINGGWFLYSIPGNLNDNGINTLADYPDLGFDGIQSTDSGGSGAIYITSNQFDAAGNFVTALLTILPKSVLYNGETITSLAQGYNLLNADGFRSDTLRVATTYGNPGVEYFVNSENDGVNTNSNVMLRSIDPRTLTLTEHAVPVGSFNPPPYAQQKQGGNTFLLDTIDNRMYNAVYRNGDVYAAFTEANNFGSGTVASIRYLALNVATNLYDLNIKYGADGKYYWFPAITTDNSNNIDIVFAYSSPTDYAGIRYTNKSAGQVTTSPSTILKTGQVTIQGFRWGDYFGIAKDPTDNSIWIYGEYAKNLRGISKVWDWGTFVGRVTN